MFVLTGMTTTTKTMMMIEKQLFFEKPKNNFWERFIKVGSSSLFKAGIGPRVRNSSLLFKRFYREHSLTS